MSALHRKSMIVVFANNTCSMLRDVIVLLTYLLINHLLIYIRYQFWITDYLKECFDYEGVEVRVFIMLFM